MINEVGVAYSRWAAEYTELFGSMAAVHPSDQQLVSTWAHSIEGEVVDAGSGPGQWTNFLAERGLSARGIDVVPEFVKRAQDTYPGIPFALGSIETLDCESGSLGGVFSWYSLIHHEPATIGVPLREFHRALRPGGALLIGFFEGPVVEKFAHAVTAAYRWPVSALSEELSAVGFDVLESHVRSAKGQRPQAAIVAQKDGHG